MELCAEAATVAGEDDIRLTRGPRQYRVRGLARNLSAESLKVTLRVSAGDHPPYVRLVVAPIESTLGAKELKSWLDTGKHSKTARWLACCRQKAVV
jgi:hypothetical protein